MEGPVAPHHPGNPQSEAGRGLSGRPDGNGDDDSGSKRKPNPTATHNKKRTKTGCLTCRKRRIKCDEGRPTCNNCIKSKRACEGYNQRVIFKDPIGAHPFSGPFGPYGYIHGAEHPLSQLAAQQARSSARGPLPTIAPRPPAFDYHHQPPHGFPNHAPYTPGIPGQPPHVLPPGFDPTTSPYPPPGAYTPQGPLTPSNLATGYGQTGPPFHAHNLPPEGLSQYYTPEGIPTSGQYATLPPPNNQPVPNDGPASAMVPHDHPQDDLYDSIDEDASMSESDDGEQASKSLMVPVVKAIHAWDSRDASLRSFSTFARNDALGEYMSSPNISELKDHAKRKLFEQFMRVTGPTMSLYERHPFDPAERRVADSNSGADEKSNIWSYTLPLVAFHHPGLLHAMLALASLQVSKLQLAPPTAALKHYHVALRRVAKNVKTPLRRLQPATIAATLLLAYFGVWNSEHTEWCSHLYGASTLFAEISFRDQAKRCLPAKSLKERQGVMKRMGLAGIGGPVPRDPNALDFDLLTTLTGYRVAAEDYGLREDQLFQGGQPPPTEKDIERFENLRDLYWWYCKMDIYQTLIGATKLFTDYEHWTQCPPRAPISKLDSIYGTYDHLILLLGRLAHFASSDQPRKRQASQANGRPPTSTSPPFVGMVPTPNDVRPPRGFTPPRPGTQDRNEESAETDPEASYRAALQEWECIRYAFETLEAHMGPEFMPLSPEYADRRDEPFGPAIQYRTYSVAGIWMGFYMGLVHLQRSHPDMPPTAMQSVGLSAHKTAEYANRIGRIAVGLSEDCSGVSEVSTVLAAALLESSLPLFVAGIQFQDDAQRKWMVRLMHNITRLTGWQSSRRIADGCESSWIKAASLGRGPPYVRAEERTYTDETVSNGIRRIDRRIQEVDRVKGNEARVVLARAERTHYALGLLGVEDDLEALELKDEPFNLQPEDYE